MTSTSRIGADMEPLMNLFMSGFMMQGASCKADEVVGVHKVSELPNSSMASNVAVDSETQPTDPLPSTNPSTTANRRSNSTSSMDDQNSNPSSPYFLAPSDNSVVLV
nr:hypothetical protein CFP56_48896 [Quercus suber]